MKAMFNAFKVDVEKDSEALRDRIKDLEEQLSRDKTKSKGETDNSQPAPAAADIIIPSIPPSIRLDPHRGPNAVTPRPTITVGSTGPNPWMPNSQSSPSALGPGAFTPWVSTHPVDTAVHTVHPSAPPFPPSPSSKIPPFAPGAVPGGWKAVKPQGLSRSRTTGNLGGASYPPLSPALYSNIYAGCPPSNSTPEYFERMNDPMTNLGYTTPVFASPPYGYPNQGPLRRSHTEATMLPPMPHYSAPPTTQPYPSQPAWRTYLPAPTTVQPAPAHRFSINHSIPVTGAQEPSYPITYGGAHLGV
ncbi:uncharacterized protein EI90DRAFT_3030081 [Cantharellus anzutake]|uniref:uncharacterized protein n=1 Tax=Cantharellus anzutake TaxID=1750568 RepID=UPI001902C954|nr:uncharacterized protein EI90DRAFT_3030081 [Cantharellus anzutake]KAF8342749.1 hypothetical protein EI90DRAFT_3030081 [Cantharellus anzutake]